MNASTQSRYDYYVTEAAKVDPAKTVAQKRKALISFGYSPAEVKTDEQVVTEAKATRTALLHRARAVKSSAKRSKAA